MPVRAQGLDELQDSLGAAGRAIADLDPEPAASNAAARAEATSPRLTGHLSTTVGWVPTSTGWAVTATAPYAVAVHARNPWIIRALDATAEQTETAYQHAVDDVLATVRGA